MRQTDDNHMQKPSRNSSYVVSISVLTMKMLEIKYNILVLCIILYMFYKTYNLCFCMHYNNQFSLQLHN